MKQVPSLDQGEFTWMNGEFISSENAKVEVLTHSLHYGSAVFEGIRFYETPKGKAIFRLEEHTERLFRSAKSMFMETIYGKDRVRYAIIETVKRNVKTFGGNEIKSGYIMPLIWYGFGKMGISPKGAPVDVSIHVWPWGKYLGEKPVKVKISPIERISPKASKMDVKISGNYANSILAHEDATRDGFNEALLLDYKGDIAEGPGENFFMVKDKVILTPEKGSILPGITRESIMKIARDEGYDVREIKMKPDEVHNADEAFFTGTAAEVTPILSIDDIVVKNQDMPITNRLKDVYLDVVHGKNDKYLDWLTFV